MRTAKILMTVLLLGAPSWVGAQAARPTTVRQRSSAPRRRRRMPPARCRARLKFASVATRRTSIAKPWRRRSVWVATRGFSRPFGTRPRSGSSCSAAGQPYAIRYAREKVEAGVRTIVVVTDRPVFFVGAGRADAKPRAGYEVAVLQIQLDGTGRGRGTMAGAARVRPDGDGGVLLDDYAEEPIALTNVTRKPS